MTDKDRTAQLLKTNRLLRKIIAGKGRVQGNFYFAGDTGGRKAGLVVTLAARDRSGKKATSQGKVLRKAIRGARFALGAVRMDGNRLTFEQHGGSASASVLKRAFKGPLIDPDAGGLSKLRFLTKARICKAGASASQEPVEDGAELTRAELETLSSGALTSEELAELVKKQGAIATLTTVLSASLQQAIDEELADSIKDSVSRLSGLESRISALTADSSPEDVQSAFDALHEERRVLAELEAVGSDPFQGGTVDATFHRSLQATSDQSLLQVREQLVTLNDSYETLLKLIDSQPGKWSSDDVEAALTQRRRAVEAQLQRLQTLRAELE